MQKQEFDFIIIGGGPGGYVAAIRAAHAGQSVALIEKAYMGGTCLNWGCIPTKALIANAELWRKIKQADRFGIEVKSPSFNFSKMISRKDKIVTKIRKGLEGLIASNKITVFNGTGSLHDYEEVKVTGKAPAILKSKRILLATGSESINVPAFPFNGKNILCSTAILNLDALPESLVIIGGGVIGCEFASFFAELGTKVYIVEALDRILPMEDSDLSKALQAAFNKNGIEVHTGTFVEKIEDNKSEVIVHLKGGKTINAKKSLVAVGRKANSEGIGLDSVGLSTDERGFIPVNDSLETEVKGIYAIGDVTGKSLLAHVASHQGIVAVDHALGKRAKMHYNAIPSVTFTHPEVASCGLTLEQAKEKGIQAKKGSFPFQALGKSQATGDTDGFASVVIDEETGQIIGAQVIGHEASSLISEMTLAISNELTNACLTETIHAHPTLPEAWLEATFASMGGAIHLPKK